MKGLIEKKTKKMKLLSTSDWPLPSHSCLRPVTQSIRGEKREAGEGGGAAPPAGTNGISLEQKKITKSGRRADM